MEATRPTGPGSPVPGAATPAAPEAGKASKDGTAEGSEGKTAPKPARAPKAETQQTSSQSEKLKARRRIVWTAVTAFLATNFLMFLRFFFPRTLFEPSSRFRIGYPSDFGLGVDERFKQSHRIWVVRRPDKMFVIYGKCTHLGCTPNWIESENKFKCPCHGSGYDMEGRNFEGPAPRPMDRAQVELDAEGQIIVDTGKLYSCAPGAKCEFDTDPNSYLAVS
jgi:cytochrome b6-f complex iron-sulfur subunit